MRTIYTQWLERMQAQPPETLTWAQEDGLNLVALSRLAETGEASAQQRLTAALNALCDREAAALESLPASLRAGRLLLTHGAVVPRAAEVAERLRQAMPPLETVSATEELGLCATFRMAWENTVNRNATLSALTAVVGGRLNAASTVPATAQELRDVAFLAAGAADCLGGCEEQLYEHYHVYLAGLRSLLRRLLPLQGADGLITVPGETAADSLTNAVLAFALLRALNLGALDEEKVLPPTLRLWRALTRRVTDEENPPDALTRAWAELAAVELTALGL